MRRLLSLGLGMAIMSLATSAVAGTLADYKAKPGQYKMENGVRVFRMQAAATPVMQNQLNAQYQQVANHRVEEQAFERGYDQGFDAGFDVGYDKANKKRKARRNRYNYGRRYSTSGYNPSYSRFRSNISYGRPAYLSRSKKKR